MRFDTVRVSWKDIVMNRECADQFLVKYWPIIQPMQYQGGNLVMLLFMCYMNVCRLVTATGYGSEMV